MKKKIIFLSFAVILINVITIAYLVSMKTSSKFEKYNFEYLETSAKQLISKYMEKTEFESEITSSYICIQNNQVFVFFDYKPLNGNPI